MLNLCVPFIYRLFGYSGMWIFCESLGKMFLDDCRFPQRSPCLFIGFHPILHRLQKCVSICCGFLRREAFCYKAVLPLVI